MEAKSHRDNADDFHAAHRITYALEFQTKKHHIQKDKIWTENPGRAREGNFASKTWIF